MKIKPGKVLILFVIICFFNLSLAYARIPHGVTVVSGEATFKRVGHHTLDVITSGNTIIDWQNLNLRAGQTIDFIQSSSLSTVLNNILFGPSVISGNIYSNGSLIFSDAQGIDFTSTARIRAASVIATSLGLSSSDFLSGQYNFDQQGSTVGMVSNEGRILAVNNGFILLLGGAVANSGTMTAKLGTVAMASGSQATVTVSNDQLLSVVVDQATQSQITGVSSAVSNTGKINAQGGTVELTAQTLSNIFDNAINQSGIINATSVSTKNGHVILNGGQEGTVIDSGDINVSGDQTGQTGGTVEILGEDIGLFGNAQIDASGANGGGQIHIGRDTNDPDGFEAKETIIDPNVTLNASATQNGNGGFIETSGDYLDEESFNIKTSGADQGHAGTWLLDPYDLTISSDTDNNNSGSSPFEPTGSSSILNVGTLETALGNGDITIETGNDSGPGNGDINVDSDITSVSSNTLTLQASGNINLNANISLGGDLTLTAGGNITQLSSTGITTTGDITATANNIYLNGTDNDFTGDLNLNSNGDPMAVSITNSGYTDPGSDLNSLINTNGAQFSSFALDLPGYNPNAGGDTSLSDFINTYIFPDISISPTFDLSLILPNYASALEIGDDSASISNFIDMSRISGTPDILHNLTEETGGNLSLKLNKAPSAILSFNNVNLNTNNGSLTVQTNHGNNIIEINGSLTISENDTVSVEGLNSTALIETPVIYSTTQGHALVLKNVTGVDGGSFALNLTDNQNQVAGLTIVSGVAAFNSFSLTLPNYTAADDTDLSAFLNDNVLNNVASPANFDLTLNLPIYAGGIVAGPGGDIDLSPLNGSIHNLTIKTAGDISFDNNTNSIFTANNIDLETTEDGGFIIIENDPASLSTSGIDIDRSLTLVGSGVGSIIYVEGNEGNVDTPVLNLTGNGSAMALINVSPNSSFALNVTDDTNYVLTSIEFENSGKLDSFSLTALNYAPGSSDTTITSLLNSEILNNVAIPASFDLDLDLPQYTTTLDFGQSGISFAPLNSTLHDLTVDTAGSLNLLSPSSPITANSVSLTTTSGNIQASYTHASTMTLAATQSDASILAAALETPVLNTTTNGGMITLDNVRGSSTVGSSFTLNMTENSNATPDLVYGQNSDGYLPAYSSFSLTEPYADPVNGSLEHFINIDILTNAYSPSNFNLTLDLPSDNHPIEIGDTAGGSYIDLGLSPLNDVINNLTIESAASIYFINNAPVLITAGQVDLLTTGNASDILVDTSFITDHITFNTLDITTDGGAITINNNGTHAFDLNMTENTNNTPNLTLGGTGTAPTFSSFSFTAPNFDQAPGALENFINNTILPYAVSPSNFNLSLNLPADTNTIEVGDDTSGTYINLNAYPLNNTIGNVTVKSAGTINFTNNGGGTLTANNADLETTGFSGQVNVEAVNADDIINLTSALTMKATGGPSASVAASNSGSGQINTLIVNTETNGGEIVVNGITENFAMNITEDSDNTPDLLASLQMSFTGLNVIEPNYNFGNIVEGNISLTNWFNFIFSNLGVTGGVSLTANVASDPHTIQMGYGASGNFIDLSQLNGGTYTGADFGDLVIKSAGEADLVADSDPIVANSVDLETTGILSNVNVVTSSGNTVTLTSGSTPLTLAATGGGNITVDNSASSTVSASTVNAITSGGTLDLNSVTGGSTGSFSPYALNVTENSGIVPTLETTALLSSFSFTAPNLTWDPDSSIETLLNTVLSNETTTDPGSNFDLTWDTTALRDDLNLANLNTSSPVLDNLTLTSFGTVNLSSPSVAGNLVVTTSNGDITESGDGVGVGGTTTLTAGNDIDLNLDNGFGFQTVTATGINITLNDINGSGLVLGNIIAGGNLTVTAANEITQTSGDTINMTSGTAGADTASFTSNTSGNIVLNNNNDFNQDPVSVTGEEAVTLNDVDPIGLVLANIVTGGNLDVTADHGISQITDTNIQTGQPGIYTVQFVVETSGNVILNNGNDFGGDTVSVIGTSTNEVELSDYNVTKLVIGDITTSESSDVTLQALGQIIINGNVSCYQLSLNNEDGGHGVTQNSSSMITAYDTANNNGISIITVNNLSLLGHMYTYGSNVYLDSPGGSITGAGIIDTTTYSDGSNTPGLVNLVAMGQINLLGNNLFGNLHIFTDSSITINDVSTLGLSLNNINASGDITITALNRITQNVSTTISSNDSTTANTGVNITSTLGNIIQNGAITTEGSQISMTAGEDLTQNGTITAGSGSNWGNILLDTQGTSGNTGILTQNGTVEGNDLTLTATSDNAATGALLQNGSLISHDSDSSNTGIGLYQGYGPGITQNEAGTMNTAGSSVFIGNNALGSGESITQAGSINTDGGDVQFSLAGTGEITQNNTGSITANQVELFLTHNESVILDGTNNTFNALAVDNTDANSPTDPISTALNAADQGNLAFGLFYNDPSHPPTSPDSISSLTLTTSGNITQLTSDDDGDAPETTTVTGPASLTAGGYIGTLATPFKFNSSNTLSLTINGEYNGNSGVFTGSSGSLQLPATPPGDIIFNGVVVYPLSASIDQELFGNMLEFWIQQKVHNADTWNYWMNVQPDQILPIPGAPSLLLNLLNPGPFQDAINQSEQEIDSAFQ